MSQIHTGFRTPIQLTAQTRAAADVVTEQDELSSFMPPVENDTLSFTLDGDAIGLPRAASFRSYDSTAPFGRERSVGTRSGKLPASSIKLPLGEYDELQLRGAGNDAIGVRLERQARQNGQSIAIRAILARAEAISTGKVELNENNLVTEIDFDRLPGHTTSAGVAWDQALGLPITDILSYQATYVVSNGTKAQGAVFSSEILAALATNDEVISFAVGRGSDLPARISEEAVLAVLRQQGIIDPIVYDKVYEDTTGTSRRAIAEDRFILTPARSSFSLEGGPLGSTEWGIPAEAFQAANGIPVEERAGIFGGAYSHSDPEGMYVLGSSIFLPALRRPNATFASVVL